MIYLQEGTMYRLCTSAQKRYCVWIKPTKAIVDHVRRHCKGIDTDELETAHVTLLYLGSLVEDPSERLVPALRRAFQDVPPLKATVTGFGAFSGNDESIPLVSLISIPGGELLRKASVDAVEYAGMDIEIRYGFVPHMTIAYSDPGTDIVLQRIPEITWPVRDVELVCEDQLVEKFHL